MGSPEAPHGHELRGHLRAAGAGPAADPERFGDRPPGGRRAIVRIALITVFRIACSVQWNSKTEPVQLGRQKRSMGLVSVSGRTFVVTSREQSVTTKPHLLHWMFQPKEGRVQAEPKKSRQPARESRMMRKRLSRSVLQLLCRTL